MGTDGTERMRGDGKNENQEADHDREIKREKNRKNKERRAGRDGPHGGRKDQLDQAKAPSRDDGLWSVRNVLPRGAERAVVAAEVVWRRGRSERTSKSCRPRPRADFSNHDGRKKIENVGHDHPLVHWSTGCTSGQCPCLFLALFLSFSSGCWAFWAFLWSVFRVFFNLQAPRMTPDCTPDSALVLFGAHLTG